MESQQHHERYALTNCTIWTGEADLPFASALLINHGLIEAVGTEDHIISLSSDCPKLDLKGQFVVPGFIDSHIHFFFGGQTLTSLNLEGVKSKGEFLQRVKGFVEQAKEGEWVHGFNMSLINVDYVVTRFDLDAVSQNNPVMILSHDGHSTLINSYVLKMIGVEKGNVPKITGGEFGLMQDGELSGLVVDQAQQLVKEKIPEMSQEEINKYGNAAQEYLLSNGITSAHHMALFGTGLVDGVPLDIAQFRQFMKENELKIRIYCATYIDHYIELANLMKSEDQDQMKRSLFRIGNIKGFIDGSLSSHSAYMFHDFCDAPNNKGLAFFSEEDIYARMKHCDDHDLQLSIHAIGDRGIHILLNGYEKLIKENGAKDRRPRIEHVQHLDLKDVARFEELGVYPSVQPAHMIHEADAIQKFLGEERAKGTYAFKSLLKHGAKLAFGSDWCVAPANPILGIHSAVNRLSLGKDFQPQEKLTVQEALMGYTIWAAESVHEEQVKGSIRKGKLADLAVIDKNLFEIDVKEIEKCEIVQTIVGGKIVYKKND